MKINKLNICIIFEIIYILFLLIMFIFFKDETNLFLFHLGIYFNIINIYIFFIRYIISIYYIFNVKKILHNIRFKIITDFIIYIILICFKMAYLYGLIFSFLVCVLEVFFNTFITIPISFILLFQNVFENKVLLKSKLKIIMLVIMALILILFLIFNFRILSSGFQALGDAILLP